MLNYVKSALILGLVGLISTISFAQKAELKVKKLRPDQTKGELYLEFSAIDENGQLVNLKSTQLKISEVVDGPLGAALAVVRAFGKDCPDTRRDRPPSDGLSAALADLGG